ncbi:MAG: DUF4846 domain-containing protein [Ferruginibacter sp.]
MLFKTRLFYFSWMLLSCNNAATIPLHNKSSVENKNPYKSVSDIPLPEGYQRMTADSNSFTAWLRQTKLKEDKTVHLYNGIAKKNQLAQFAVMDISVGDKDLQQCADAVMRLRAEYLFCQKRFSEIVFYDNNKTAYAFLPPYTSSRFHHYMQQVFGMCGSASLSRQLHPKNAFKEIAPGDVLIRGGFPGHAVLVTDVAMNSRGQKIYLLAQGYMPAQDIHILVNPSDPGLSPWYLAGENDHIITPEYIFSSLELKSW